MLKLGVNREVTYQSAPWGPGRSSTAPQLRFCAFIGPERSVATGETMYTNLASASCKTDGSFRRCHAKKSDRLPGTPSAGARKHRADSQQYRRGATAVVCLCVLKPNNLTVAKTRVTTCLHGLVCPVKCLFGIRAVINDFISFRLVLFKSQM